jgi:hypothetical protein
MGRATTLSTTGRKTGMPGWTPSKVRGDGDCWCTQVGAGSAAVGLCCSCSDSAAAGLCRNPCSLIMTGSAVSAH